MIPSLEQLKSTLSSLPAVERAELAQYLLRSLDPDEEGAKAEWLALAERRMANARAGRVVGIPAEQVRPSAEDPALEIPPGILRSMQAYWRDLPELLKSQRNRDKWVVYHGDERIGIERDKVTLMREVVRRAIPDDAYYVAVIHPRQLPPWEPEEVDPIGPWHFDDYEEEL